MAATMFSSEQMESHECDIITGFHIEDRERHVFVLEGLHRMGIRELWTNLPHHPTQGKQDASVDVDHSQFMDVCKVS